ncbi:ABC transporter substrate-binding protein [Paenarthrobacter sp. Z7-10]|uniref:ABC transporter substrate-binding protein n=1 Tax=Paenarthrobacter sp. Z7-10 TaxID=2787635 RepID=UPI0022A9ED9E|nr:ABC transporter substrate-binding protein [Paenarthrobacter sp. Z7-10]MCZ2404737.1 ABC transporter substrate-binding protein [Paenarthrobacter sp. Z7-10]
MTKTTLQRRILATSSIILTATLAVGLSGCRTTSAASADAAAEPEVTMIVGGLEKVIYMPAKLAEGLGLFEKEGVKVNLLGEQSGASAENSLLTGASQAVVGFYDHTIDLQAKGQCIESVAQLANIPGEAEMVATSQADKITGAKDFAGKNMGITSLGSSTDFLTQALAGQAGVKSYTPAKVGAGQTFIAAMNNGGIDAGMTTDPTIAQLVKSGQGKVLIDMRTEEGTRKALGGLYPAVSVYMSCDYVQKNPKTVQKVVNAFVGALSFINTHSAAEIAAKMPKEYANAGADLYEKSINDTKTMFNKDGKMDADGAKNVLKILDSYSANVKGKGSSIDLSKTYTTEFVDKVSAK